MLKRSETKCGKRKGEYCKLHNPAPAGDATSMDKRRFVMQGVIAYNSRQAAGKKPLCKTESTQIEAEREELAQQELKKKIELHSFRVDDMRKNMKLKTDPKTGKRTVSVFRAGVPNPPAERGVEKDSYAATDEHMPEGRQDRTSGIFASPTLHGVTGWVRGTSHVVKDWGVRELRVDPDKVYVYSVRAWEICSSYDSTPEKSKAYWDSGITLTQWMQKLNSDPDLDPQEWEILIGEKQLEGVRPVSADRVSRSDSPYYKGERSENIYNLLTKGLGKKG